MSSEWVAAGAGLAGAIIGGGLSGLNAKRTWLRDERLEVLATMVNQANTFADLFYGNDHPRAELLRPGR